EDLQQDKLGGQNEIAIKDAELIAWPFGVTIPITARAAAASSWGRAPAVPVTVTSTIAVAIIATITWVTSIIITIPEVPWVASIITTISRRGAAAITVKSAAISVTIISTSRRRATIVTAWRFTFSAGWAFEMPLRMTFLSTSEC